MPRPVITAIIPTYQRPDLLRRSIANVLAQTYSDLKVLVCDNASGDETREVVAEFQRRDPRVRYHCHPENTGPTYNIRSGVEMVDTEAFSILSDDDILLPDFYRHAVDAFERYPDAGFFCGQVVQYDERVGTHNVRPSRLWRDGYHEAGRWAPLMSEVFFIWTSCVFTTRVRDTLGPTEDIHTTDEIYILRAAAAMPFVVSLVPCAIFCHTGANWSLNMTPAMLLECYEAIRATCDKLPNVNADERRQIIDNVDRHYRIAANGMLRSALEAGDRTRIEHTASFLTQRGWLTGRRRLRADLAQRSLPLRSLVSWITRLTAGYKRMRRSRWQKMSLEEVVARYSAAGGEAG